MRKTALRNLLIPAPAILLLLAVAASATRSREDYRPAVDRIREAGLSSERAYALLGRITSVGGRLTGSPQAAAAVELSRRLMEELGLDKVHTEPVEVGHWDRGRIAEAAIVGPDARGRPRWPSAPWAEASERLPRA